jgi:hypothetical protein
MLEWIAEKIMAVVNWVPAWIVEEGSPNFMLIRGMFGLILIVLIVYVIAMWPSRSSIAEHMDRMSKRFLRKR